MFPLCLRSENQNPTVWQNNFQQFDSIIHTSLLQLQTDFLLFFQISAVILLRLYLNK